MAGPKNTDTPNDLNTNEASTDLETTEKKPAVQSPQPAASFAVAQMPSTGLAGLAAELYPDDRDDKGKMAEHVSDLFALNAGQLRNEESFMVGQLVKIPAGL